MNTLKIHLYLFGVLLSLTALSQPSSDSLYTTPIWKVRALAQIALRAKECDTLVTQQEKEINAGIQLLTSKDSLLVIRSRTNAILNNENLAWQARFENQTSLTGIEKRKKRKWIFLSIGLAALGVYTNLP